MAAADGIRLDDPAHLSRVGVTVHKSQVIHFHTPFAEALVADPEFADVTPLTDHALYVIGKKVGQTRITVLDNARLLMGVIDLEIGFDVTMLRRALREDAHLANVRVRSHNGHVLLMGVVPDAPSQGRALAIAEQFAPGAVTNSLSVRASQQVLLEVRFAEVDRTAARDLGINWAVLSKKVLAATGATGSSALDLTAALNPVQSIKQGGGGIVPLAGIPSGATPYGQAIISLLNNHSGSAEVLIEALEKRGLARRLAEPNLVTLSGDTANFLAGGEFPYPVAQTGALGGLATITIEFKKFGIGLAFTPTVLGEGQINLKIEPEVSDIDPNHTFTYGGGITVPGLIVRRASATLELRDGQSFAIAGLLDNKHTTDQTQLPWLGQVPVLGTLFRSASYLKSETDLVILVTPRLVKPALPDEHLATPLDQRLPGNDVDFFLLGRAERDKHFPAPYGHILDVAVSGWSPSVHVEAGGPEGNHDNLK